MVLSIPALHERHVAEPTAAQVPATHITHVKAAADEYVPASHDVHASAVVAPNRVDTVPALQAEHVVFASDVDQLPAAHA